MSNADNPNGWAAFAAPLISPEGFREYDGRWRFPSQFNLAGATRLGRALGELQLEQGADREIIVGHDFRSYSQSVANALVIGLIQSGARVVDIGTVLSPMAYFSRTHLGIEGVAMVTASHNPNGWTGLKAGFKHPFTFGEEEMRGLKELVEGTSLKDRSGGGYRVVQRIDAAYGADLRNQFSLSRKVRAVCATGNGTAGKFVPGILQAAGIEVLPLHNEPDAGFPNYNPNPESLAMLQDMAHKVLETGADLALGFDGDGDRLGVVDANGQPVFADKIGVLLARSLASRHADAKFVADIKSTGLFAMDPELRKFNATTEYWKTGHSHMKRRIAQTGALAGFEKSGHFYFGPPVGRGYDDAVLAALELCRLLDQDPEKGISDLVSELPAVWTTPTMSPSCPDNRKYQVVDSVGQQLKKMAKQGQLLGGRPITSINSVNGIRCELDNGSWGLIRASSNTPNLVVVCESTDSETEMRLIFEEIDRLLTNEEFVGEYDQRI